MKTYPKHIFDYLLWPIIKLVWEPFSLKRSHWWHWKKFLYTQRGRLITSKVIGNKKAKNRDTFWSNLIQTNFGWNETAVIEPIAYTDKYQLGFFETDKYGKKFPQTCTLVLRGKIAILRGPKDIEVYAFTYPEHRPLVVKVINELPKNTLSMKGIKLI